MGDDDAFPDSARIDGRCTVIPWLHLDTAAIPGGGELRLMQRGIEFSIMLGPNELMNSRRVGSEQALATIAWERIRSHKRPHILIGGLGMGFTLRAALAEIGADGAITVAELVPAVVKWARGPMAEVYGDCLSDPRVTILEGDVGEAIRVGRSRYDAILLDVDNGPQGLTRPANQTLYGIPGLAAVRAALRPGGVLAIWSQGPDREFCARMRKNGFVVEEIIARSAGRRGAQYVVWVATPAARGR
jgi:spermidine synthase